MHTAQEAFGALQKELSRTERLRLARLLLDDLVDNANPGVEYSDEWSDEDLQDLTRHSLSREESQANG